MPTIKLDNVTLTGSGATWQKAFVEWVGSQVASLSGPEGQLPPEEEIRSYLLERFRAMRKRIMDEYDWMFLEDSPASEAAKQKAAVFRQALRDIPQNYPDIRTAIFPDPEA